MAEDHKENLGKRTQDKRKVKIHDGDAGFTWKVAIFVTVCIIVFAYTVAYGTLVQIIPNMQFHRVPSPGGLAGVLVLLLINLLSHRILKRMAFTSKEIVTAYWTLSIGGLVLTTGWVIYIIFPIMGLQKAVTIMRSNVLTYRPILNDLSSWAFPKSKEAVKGFWEGQSTVPWGEWLMPILVWGVFFVIALFFMICLGALMFRRWSRIDRLVYPLVEPVLELAGESRLGYRDKSSIWTNRPFWVGAVIAAIPPFLTGLSRYFPVIPTFQYQIDLQEIKSILPQPILYGYFLHWPPLFLDYRLLRFDTLIIGMGFLINLEVLFSVWFLSLLYGAFRSILVVYLGTGAAASWVGPIRPYVLIAGAFTGVVIYTVYQSRRDLADLVKSAFGKKSKHSDYSDEWEPPLSPRFIVFGGTASFVLLIVWTRIFLNLSPWVGVLVFSLISVIALGFARIRAETGIPTNNTHGQFYEYLVMMDIVWRRNLGNTNVAALNFFTPFTWGALDTFPVLMQEAWTSADRCGIHKRSMLKGMVFAAVLAMIIGMVSLLPVIYSRGAELMHFNTVRFATWFDKEGFNGWGNRLEDPRPQSLLVFAIGAGITIGLVYLRTMFLWWPLHPIGFVLAIWEGVSAIWPSFMLAWVIKLLVYRYGGVVIAQRLKGFFMGLILGGIIVTTLFSLLGLIVPPTVSV
jgi:hypothetical protein